MRKSTTKKRMSGATMSGGGGTMGTMRRRGFFNAKCKIKNAKIGTVNPCRNDATKMHKTNNN